ncbi:MAG: TIGR03790 family protein [Luteolibacter sp.]|uniref:TIGR03790 family protein n=1 Tax=Luteolibacter sp. TaxID=1962973 RepID=UPI0032663458
MRFSVLLLALFAGLPWLAEAAISPESVAILYNASVPDSKKLAETYRQARNIPKDNVIGLEMPTAQDISREDYERSILKPLRGQFEVREWWTRRSEDQKGARVTLPVANKIRVLVTMRGVPLRITPVPKPPGGMPAGPIDGHDEASVDSELSMFGVEGLPLDGVLQNKYYKADKPIADANVPFLVLTARIDAPTVAICERMIRDAVDVESTGLWGRAYVDIANKFPQGDQWLEDVVKADLNAGIPTVVDRFNETYPPNYPMTDCSIYYGWYDWNISGPFLNTKFQFRKGAVAMHLHSFSAEQLTDGSKNWSGGLLARGAAVTIGNVYEPYLHLTHDFGIIQQKLLAGYTWGEACWMAMPVTSWQGVVLGDPLYRPFRCLDGGGMKQESDIDFRALRAAAVEWKESPGERQRQVEKASERMKSGILAEALGLEMVESKDPIGAANLFRTAKTLYVKQEDQLRQDLNLISLERTANHKDIAIRSLHDAELHYGSMPEAEALKALLVLLDPPPPAPAPVGEPGKKPVKN